MDTEDVHSLVEDLDSNIDDLEEALAPLLQKGVLQSTSKLPLLDKAKLYVLATYAIESILFSSLRLNGVDAKSHAVFNELARVKEYYGKIKAAETAGAKRSSTLDVGAASRFIKHGLAGNEKYDRERAERIAREKTGAKRKLEDMSVGTHTRFDGVAKRIKAADGGDDVTPAVSSAATSTHGDDDADMADPDDEDQEVGRKQRKPNRQKRYARHLKKLQESEGQPIDQLEDREDDVKIQSADDRAEVSQNPSTDGRGDSSSTKKSKQKRKKRKAKEVEDQRAEDMN